MSELVMWDHMVPTTASKHPAAVARKIAQVAAGIRSTNPWMPQSEIMRLAINTVRRYPKVVRESGRMSGRSGACADGDHASCKMEHGRGEDQCNCPYHGADTKPRGRKDYSGACADGDHASCKMSHGDGDDDCACPNQMHKTTARKTALDYDKEERYTDFPEGSTAVCAYCRLAILLDQREGGGPGKDWGDGPEDWVGNGGRGMDYGCSKHPGSDEEGSYGHVPIFGTIKEPAQ